MPNIAETLKQTTLLLRENGIADPTREAKSLLAFALNKNHTFLVAHPEYELSAGEQQRCRELATRRASREPLQYITGRQEFYGLDFTVTRDVLIPRPETELIVESAINVLRFIEKPEFCEVGIGSGCIAVSILTCVKTASAVGLDICENALKVAGINAEMHRVADRLELRISDVFDDLPNEQFDLIVSNPPYISLADIKTLQPEVRDFEPLTALTDGGDGLSLIEKIINDAPGFLKEGGFLLMEIGFGQSGKVEAMFDRKIWSGVECLVDLQNIPRTIKAVRKAGEKG